LTAHNAATQDGWLEPCPGRVAHGEVLKDSRSGDTGRADESSCLCGRRKLRMHARVIPLRADVDLAISSARVLAGPVEGRQGHELVLVV
jgi:hypothetical protein